MLIKFRIKEVGWSGAKHGSVIAPIMFLANLHVISNELTARLELIY